MYSLKGVFPEPKKDPKKNFIKENMKQLKFQQAKGHKSPKFTLQHSSGNTISSGERLNRVKSTPSNKGGKVTVNASKLNSKNMSRKNPDLVIKKGDMAEFLRRKEMRQMKAQSESVDEEEVASTESSGRLRDMGCQTVESHFSKNDPTKLTMLYPKKDDDAEAKSKASGDMARRHSPRAASHPTPQRGGDLDLFESEKRSKINSILERKEPKDPYLPSAGYQKGVVPKYLRERKEQVSKEIEGSKIDDATTVCPPGHVTLPDTERKETLRMLRNSFAELVSELNKMPVKTDTLRMRNRKMELEKQLAKLEEGIKVFSRPKVFVKIGE